MSALAPAAANSTALLWDELRTESDLIRGGRSSCQLDSLHSACVLATIDVNQLLDPPPGVVEATAKLVYLQRTDHLLRFKPKEAWMNTDTLKTVCRSSVWPITCESESLRRDEAAHEHTLGGLHSLASMETKHAKRSVDEDGRTADEHRVRISNTSLVMHCEMRTARDDGPSSPCSRVRGQQVKASDQPTHPARLVSADCAREPTAVNSAVYSPQASDAVPACGDSKPPDRGALLFTFALLDTSSTAALYKKVPNFTSHHRTYSMSYNG
jgi:hypothetical protein